jgi:hypothetical protein
MLTMSRTAVAIASYIGTAISQGPLLSSVDGSQIEMVRWEDNTNLVSLNLDVCHREPAE